MRIPYQYTYGIKDIFPVDRFLTTGMEHNLPLFLIWVFLSNGILITCSLALKTILLSDKKEPGTFAKAVCLGMLLICIAYIFAYGEIPCSAETYGYTKTPSLIGLEHPWAFRGWCMLVSTTLFLNIMYLFKKYHYNNPFAVIAACLGASAIFLTMTIPTAGPNLAFITTRGVGNLLGALFMIALMAYSVASFLHQKKQTTCKRSDSMVFWGFIITITVELISLGRTVTITTIPLFIALVFLFLLNFTPLFKKDEQLFEL